MDFVAAPSGAREEDRRDEEGGRRAYVRKAFQKAFELCTLRERLWTSNCRARMAASNLSNLPSLPTGIYNLQTQRVRTLGNANPQCQFSISTSLLRFAEATHRRRNALPNLQESTPNIRTQASTDTYLRIQTSI
ncbi:hypothetical protein CCMSSC00406_0008602 [Pleurotus cornucopiae]|uniref:Uncharacterized protein n=1 Tax=Pleurotus cornucopiae TaxID=5321 RepID=A0ACB7IGZ3_PLECO|nr:hypothetical protein CCMSSC00406_0008602 [Pleurotus cornucopiae]